MKIGIFYPHSIYGSLGSIRRVKEIAKRLKLFLNAEVILYSPYESKIIKYNDILIKPVPNLFTSFHLSGLLYYLSKKIYYSKYLGNLLLERIIRLSKSLAKNLTKTLKRDEISILQVEHDFSVPLCLEVGKRLKIPIIADLHNITSEELVSANVLKRGSKMYKTFHKFLDEALSQTDLICTVSDYMANFLIKNFSLKKNKVIVVSPGGYPRTISLTKRKSNKVVFAGTVAYREHVDLFIKSIPWIKRVKSGVEFYITKKGDQLKEIMKMSQRLDLKINWFWYPSEDTFFDFLSAASIGILTSKNDEARRMGTPIKLFDYMSVGLPVIANDIGGWCKIISDEKIGILTKDEPKDFASATLILLDNEELRIKMAENALVAIKEKYNWDKTVKPLIKAYKNFSE